ncbi:hypothetical protein SEA_VENTI_64 [Mycobacterium phage Venti]|uniref:Uncharacterized protein n=3 Tax=Caudoviricetes TaxID=2731619 RepID=A0A514A5U0_9CAUD|nr:hypothetical protein I5J45_gp62 [Mycobacterium phage Bartholomew]ASR86437.1 hypothetical protein SEA_BARTHOLOMEW_62 [Mycobacterium phage Bartholomew]QDH48634.1 hypothetical protein SEA_TECHAGE_67 [Mycobacterium phage Techage]UVK59461.1 hypothetical protein SEA_VENTI_64 [Mycobacterium phage Venti]
MSAPRAGLRRTPAAAFPAPHEHEHEGNVFMCPHWIDEPHEHTPTEEE